MAPGGNGYMAVAAVGVVALAVLAFVLLGSQGDMRQLLSKVSLS